MDWKSEYKNFLWIVGLFLFAYFMPIEIQTFRNSIIDAFALLNWYAQQHVLLCLIPAFFIAGVIAVFMSQSTIIKYLGSKTNKIKSYLIASISGTILAVCSCTVLPLFSSIHKRGAGLGPAIAFLYSGPAINILAIILTARILGLELGIARVIGAVSFSILIGLIMELIYRNEEKEKGNANPSLLEFDAPKPLWQTTLHFFILVAILVFVNFGKPENSTEGFWYFIYSHKWYITSFLGFAFALSLIYIVGVKFSYVLIGSIAVFLSAIVYYKNPIIPFFIAVIATTIALTYTNGEANQWLGETWSFTKQIMPLLGAGILVSGFLLGHTESNGGIIPKDMIFKFVGGNSLWSNLFASVTGAFMYFATLTEIPILQGLINNGMGKGPALALLLAGPALSLPNMLVIRNVIGTQKTIVYVSLVIFMASISGMIYGYIF